MAVGIVQPLFLKFRFGSGEDVGGHGDAAVDKIVVARALHEPDYAVTLAFCK